MKKKPTAGGKRKGAGRKPIANRRRKISVTVSPEADDAIRRAAFRGSLTVSEIADELFRSLG